MLQQFSMNVGGGSSAAAFDPTSASTTFEVFDDFFDGVNSGQPYGLFGWQSITNGTGGGNVQQAPAATEKNRFGIWKLQAGTAATNVAGVMSANTGFMIAGNSTWTFACAINIPTLDDGTDTYAINIGLMNTSAITPSHGIYFQYQKSTSVNWNCTCMAGSVATTTGSGVAADTNWNNFRIDVINATSAKFYINGTLVATITTNIPTAAGQTIGPILYMNKTAGTLNRSFAVDWCYMQYVLGSARGTY